MGKLFVRFAFFALLFVLGPAAAHAQKIGYTDHELIIVNMPEYRTVQEQLQKDYQGGQTELQTMAKDYQDKLERYQKQQAMLSPESRQTREKELMDLQTKIQSSAQDKEQKMAQRQAELMNPLFEKVQTAIDVVAEERGLDLVLKSQVGDQPVILYRNDKTVVDITLDVAKKLGLNVNEQPAAAPAAQGPAANKPATPNTTQNTPAK